MQQINDIKDFADIHSVPIMKDEGITFICDYIKEHKVRRVLEIGTAIGFSSINFARVSNDVKVSTIELDQARHKTALKNIADNSVFCPSCGYNITPTAVLLPPQKSRESVSLLLPPTCPLR